MALATTPINTLPFDIFQMIITGCREEEGEPFALASSHVCRIWRRHVLDMPLLWNRLEFATDAPKWDMLEVKLKRSGQAPLDIVLEEKVFLKSGMPRLRRIMQMIVPHVERWRLLRMEDVPHKIRRVLLDQLRGKFAPLLHRVEVVQGKKYYRTWGSRTKSTSRHWDARKIFDGAPNLRHLEWTTPEADYRLLPRFQNLLTLKMGPGTLAIKAEQFIQLVFRILSAAPALEELSLSHEPDWDDDLDIQHVENFVQPPTTHASLQLFHITMTTCVRSVILRSLILPKLRSLGGPLRGAEIDILCCKTLAQSNSATSLHEVLITGSPSGVQYQDPAPHSRLPSLPVAIIGFQSLVVLDFRHVDFGGDKWLPDLGSCCPRLKSLTLLHCTGYTVKAIRTIVEARMDSEEVESLESLAIHADWRARASVASAEEATWFSRVLKFDSGPDLSSWYGINEDSLDW
ncbi:hypothetical protein FRC01_004299 [Tulasnella sp. 417]|nr:hypothetical protein FRC01_004299 [Tulasnella sp. 417]